jgi:hypothetical protein
VGVEVGSGVAGRGVSVRSGVFVAGGADVKVGVHVGGSTSLGVGDAVLVGRIAGMVVGGTGLRLLWGLKKMIEKTNPKATVAVNNNPVRIFHISADDLFGGGDVCSSSSGIS